MFKFKVNDKVVALPTLFDPKLGGHELIVKMIKPDTTYTVQEVLLNGAIILVDVGIFHFTPSYWRLAGGFSLGEIE
jgi:hypothetical protein